MLRPYHSLFTSVSNAVRLRMVPALFLMLTQALAGQTISDCKRRFDSYINFQGRLSQFVTFEKQSFTVRCAGGNFRIYENELPALLEYFSAATPEQQAAFLAAKGMKLMQPVQLDSLVLDVSSIPSTVQKKSPPLSGVRIAIDPGHFATSMKEAAAEQKYLYFSRKTGGDTVRIFESQLTFSTARILQSMLEEQGAFVSLTRQQADHTSFGCTYTQWLENHRVRVLDSMVAIRKMPSAKRALLLKANSYKFFWDFFRDHDLANRAVKMNEFDPAVSVIIHYNVDEKNAPWKNVTRKNYTMTFIGGAMTAGDLGRPENVAHMIRYMVTRDLERSQELAKLTVANFSKVLGIPLARPVDAEYLAKNCMVTASPGVFCRNLFLCRKVLTPLVYGESLYQDNADEAAALMKNDLDVYGIKTSSRIRDAARCYFDAIMQYMKNN